MPNERDAVEAYLHEHIPLSRQMGVRVKDCSEAGVTLSAPLGPNLNHESNAFGGSISALATLTGWTWLYVRLRSRAAPSRIVIQRSQVDYLRPIHGDFAARTMPIPEADHDRLVDTVQRRTRGRITLRCEVVMGEVLCARFEGAYVVME